MKSLSVKLGVILIGFVLFNYTQAWGEDRMFYGGNDNYSCFYDLESINHLPHDVVRVSDYQFYTKAGKDLIIKELGGKYENLSYTKTLWEINCADKKFRFLSLTHYSKENNAIYSWKLLYSSNSPAAWSSFTPGSLGEKLHKAVCK
jgi:hypothetical protein